MYYLSSCFKLELYVTAFALFTVRYSVRNYIMKNDTCWYSLMSIRRRYIAIILWWMKYDALQLRKVNSNYAIMMGSCVSATNTSLCVSFHVFLSQDSAHPPAHAHAFVHLHTHMHSYTRNISTHISTHHHAHLYMFYEY